MTGQVKEDILSRFGELGVFVHKGQLQFKPDLLRKDEFLKTPSIFEYVNLTGEALKIDLVNGTLGFTYCQVPIIYELGKKEYVKVLFKDAAVLEFDKLILDVETSRKVFERTEDIERILVYIIK